MGTGPYSPYSPHATAKMVPVPIFQSGRAAVHTRDNAFLDRDRFHGLSGQACQRGGRAHTLLKTLGGGSLIVHKNIPAEICIRIPDELVVAGTAAYLHA